MGAWYRAGTVSITSGSKNVVGVDTYFVLNASIGDIFTIDGNRVYEIETITDNTHLSLKTAFGETTVSGGTYGICRNFTGTTNAILAEKLTTLLNSWQAREDEFANWLAGTANGGTNGDGKYPLTNAIGQTSQVDCPAKIATGKFADGNVLIGANSSQSDGNLQVTGNATLHNSNSTDSTTNVWFNLVKTGIKGWSLGNKKNGSDYDFVINNDTNGGATDLVCVKTNGNVLIGTTTDAGTGKLQVNGSISATGSGSYFGDCKFYNSVQMTISLNGTAYGFVATGLLSNNLELGYGATSGSRVIATVSSTGLAVTGLTTTDTLRINTAPTSSIATTSTHKVAVNLNGTTYYLLATNV